MRKYSKKIWMILVCFITALFITNFATYTLKDYKVSAVEHIADETVNTVDKVNVSNPPEQKKKVEKKDVKAPKIKLYKKRGKTYCKVNGKKARRKMVSTKKHTYITDKKGAVVKGWTKFKGAYYCLSRSQGRMYKKTKIDGIKVNKDGKAKITKASLAKIKTMIKAKKLVNQITKPTDTKKQKKRKCFDWVAKAPYVRYRMLKPIYKDKGWEVSFANDIFDKGSGCCVSESAALAFMLHEAGYKDVYVCHDTSHAWVELNGLVYDVLFARAKNWNKYYACTYKNYRLYAVGKRKI